MTDIDWMRQSIYFIYFLGLLSPSGELKSQENSTYIFSEPTSLIRGNQAINLSIAKVINNVYVSIGLDYIYNHVDSDQDINLDRVSYAISNKLGYSFNKRKKSRDFVGVRQKLGRFHVYQRDSEDGKISLPYKKSFVKYTIMAYYESCQNINEYLFWSFDFAVGYAVIVNSNYSPAPEYQGLASTGRGFDFSYLFEHASHNIAHRRSDAPALQFNLSFGYYISK